LLDKIGDIRKDHKRLGGRKLFFKLEAFMDEHNKKRNLYLLTAKGLALTPIIVEISIWSDENVRELNSIMGDSPEIAIMKGNKEAFIQMIKDNYKTKTEKFY